ncbi:S9 family peptidase [Streptomyces ficellus]|uniref:S9 family peptidase n=1 Tax=Streptomyces ficellus TaxID=1977088 RepID=A0A6I6FVL3_9ACTN|nr:prolyl oligopeptidase family serine peptidase [Streptomyces ficellus]QGV81746.1 S9 family peptidase [Streptomyces ficellus]
MTVAETAPGAVHAPAFPRQFARTRRFALGVPGGFAVSPDGARVLFVRTGAGSDSVGRLWLYEDGRERLLADPATLGGGPEGEGPDGVALEGAEPEAERVRRERARAVSTGVVDFAVDRHARVAVFALLGAVWAVRTDGGAPWRVPTAGPAVDPRPSPDGSLIAYVTGGALRVAPVAGGAKDVGGAKDTCGAEDIRAAGEVGGAEDVLLAAPEGPDVTYGLSDHVSAESVGRPRGYWWSPDGDALLVARTDHARVNRWYLADPADPAKPPRAIRYPAAGTANADVSLHVLRLDGTRTPVRTPARAEDEAHPPGVWTDPRYEYVTVAGWDGHGPFAELQTRDQRTTVLLAVDPVTGGTRPLLHRHDPDWVELTPGTPTRTAAGAVVTTLVRDDVRGLCVGGVPSPPGLEVRAVLGTVGERVYFTACEDPAETHVWVYDPAAGGFDRVSREPGVHTAVVGGGTVVLDGRTPGGRSVTVLREGEPAGRIAVLAETPLVTPRPVHLALGARRLRSHLYLPSWHEPGAGRLPVLLSPYAGYGIQLAVRASGWYGAVAQWFAEQGFAVLITDGRGTPGRGRAWETAIRGDRLTAPLADQVDALHAAAERYPDLDLERVGIRGWSYGGYLAIGAVLHRPDVFHAAVAGAAPTDRRLYDTHWEERFLGHPEVQPDNYERSSHVPYAHLLSRPLLLMHGFADDNVVPAHTVRFSAALLAAGRPHSVLPLPGATHAVTREEVASSQLSAEVGFFRRSLHG